MNPHPPEWPPAARGEQTDAPCRKLWAWDRPPVWGAGNGLGSPRIKHEIWMAGEGLDFS